MTEPHQIIHRVAFDDFQALQVADAAARLGWRVVSVTPNLNRNWSVWVEAPVEANPLDLDREHQRLYLENDD